MPEYRRAFSDLTDYTLNRKLMQSLDEDFCRQEQVVLLGPPPESKKDVVPLGMLDPSRHAVAGDVERATGLTVRRIQLNAYEIDQALSFAFGDADAEETTLKVSPVKEKLWLTHERSIVFERDQKPSQMTADLIVEAIRRRASDIHIEVYSNDVDLRFRVDGVLRQISTPVSLGNVRQVLSHIKVLSELDIAEHREAQDGHIITRYTPPDGESRRVDFRVSFLPGPYGEDCVLRILDETQLCIPLEELGMSEEKFDVFHDMLHDPGGMILVTGPTAAGKTTTIYAAIDHVNDGSNKILTVEDPIEYEMAKVNQKQINAVMSFADYTRAFMRQNPDVVMIGEVRDEETASMATRAAQMGHLVLTTLHTRDAPSAVARLLSLGAERSILAAGLLGALSQRLVRRVCPKCVEEYEPDPEVLGRLPGLPKDMNFRHGRGCDHCDGTGYRGRTGVFELLRFDADLRRGVALGLGVSGETLPLPERFKRMYDYALDKAARGVTTVEEIARAVPVPDDRLGAAASDEDE